MARSPSTFAWLPTLGLAWLISSCGEPSTSPADGADEVDVAVDAEDATLPDATAQDAAEDGTEAGGDDAGSDAMADAAPSDVVDADATDSDTAPTEPDTGLDRCGDGIVDPGEACDDGNLDDTDACTQACALAACGDGIVNLARGATTVDPVPLTNPFGVEGFVCGLGGSCPSAACDVRALPDAPEHGLCQSLGFERALEVDWTGSEGANRGATPRAYNWSCEAYVCSAGERDTTEPACPAGVMLRRLVCETAALEPCDDGADNGIAPNACRPDCSLPVCGDGVTDTAFGETCDDANDVPDDGCNRCLAPSCGDGIVQTNEACDDGNDDNTDECTDACERPACGDGVVQPSNGEQCDDGADNSDRPDACRVTCVRAGCGDLVLDTGETCDDGNRVGGDGCSASCDIE